MRCSIAALGFERPVSMKLRWRVEISLSSARSIWLIRRRTRHSRSCSPREAGFIIILLRNVRYTPAFVFSITSRVIDAIQSGVQLGRVERRITMSIRNLKSILIADAVTCTGVFAISLLAAAPVGALLGLPANIVAVGGWICLAAALLMVVAAFQKAPNPALVKLIALGNLGWVAASFAVVASFRSEEHTSELQSLMRI